ncbi:hypothetical protein SETIT_3G383200v2 [Setaria italica]|uniref:Knottin scorpion toxin-like domain-containing protein n=1 Tax=Setaria italica TaxID=4555 RepID=A0A368QN68_SETIT|nr:hypothetical protein SETIT_3G383200v2 [Setaria italica]
MKNKIAATALVLLLLTYGAEAKGTCNEAACSLACVRAGHKNGGRCIGYFYDYCKCNKSRRDEKAGGKAPPLQDGLGEDELATFMAMAWRARGPT